MEEQYFLLIYFVGTWNHMTKEPPPIIIVIDNCHCYSVFVYTVTQNGNFDYHSYYLQ